MQQASISALSSLLSRSLDGLRGRQAAAVVDLTATVAAVTGAMAACTAMQATIDCARILETVATTGRQGADAVASSAALALLVAMAHADQGWELQWQSAKAIKAVAAAGERSAVLAAGGFEAIVDLLVDASQDLEKQPVAVAAAEAVGVLVQSGEAKLQLSRQLGGASRLVQAAVAGLQQEGNSLARAGLVRASQCVA